MRASHAPNNTGRDSRKRPCLFAKNAPIAGSNTPYRPSSSPPPAAEGSFPLPQDRELTDLGVFGVGVPSYLGVWINHSRLCDQVSFKNIFFFHFNLLYHPQRPEHDAQDQQAERL